MPLPGRRGGRSKAGEVRTTARGHSRAGAAAARSDPHRHPTRPVRGGTGRAWGRVREGGRGRCSAARPSARGVVEPASGTGSHRARETGSLPPAAACACPQTAPSGHQLPLPRLQESSPAAPLSLCRLLCGHEIVPVTDATLTPEDSALEQGQPRPAAQRPLRTTLACAHPGLRPQSVGSREPAPGQFPAQCRRPWPVLTCSKRRHGGSGEPGGRGAGDKRHGLIPKPRAS